jgi:hypothetical protein
MKITEKVAVEAGRKEKRKKRQGSDSGALKGSENGRSGQEAVRKATLKNWKI